MPSTFTAENITIQQISEFFMHVKATLQLYCCIHVLTILMTCVQNKEFFSKFKIPQVGMVAIWLRVERSEVLFVYLFII